MGCDIHMQIEYRNKDSKERFNGFGKVFNPGRAYHMFAVMAGVRDDEGKKMFDPRGLPENISYQFEYGYYFYVHDETMNGERTVNREDAERWVGNGFSKYKDSFMHWVSDPDAHSESWLTLDEFLSCFNEVEKEIPDLAGSVPEYVGAIAAMQAMEKCGYETRIVFYFDC